MRRCLLCLFLLLSPLMASGMDLLDTYHRAFEHDADFAAARAEYLAGQEAVVQGRAGLLPEIALGADARRNHTDPRGLPRDNYDSTAWSVQLVQPVFRMQNFVSAQHGALRTELAGVFFQQAHQDLMLRVAEAYFDVLSAQEVLAAQQRFRDAAAEQRERARTSFEVGLVTIADVHEAQSNFDLAQAELIAAESALDIAGDSLARIVGGPPGELALLREEVAFAAPQPADPQRWVDSATQGSLSVHVGRLQQELATRDVEHARAGHLPTLDLVASHGASHRQGGSDRPRNDASMLGLEFNLPLYAGGRVSSVTREQVALKERADAELESARRAAALAAREAWVGVTSGLARIHALEAAEVSSQSSLESDRLGYEVGLRLNVDVLNSLSRLAETQRELAGARYETLLSQLRLKAAAGELSEADLEAVNVLLDTQAVVQP